LDCHGEPAGDIDLTGYQREGYKTGDVAGALSIIMPIDIYLANINSSIALQTLFTSVVIALIMVFIYLGITILMRRLERVNATLDQQRIQLEEANELLKQERDYKSDFLATMSHELRTPLTSILAFTEIWLNEDKTLEEAPHNNSNAACAKTDHKTVEGPVQRTSSAVQEINENSQLLLQMVNNILETARVDAGRMELAPEAFDLVDLVDTVKGTIGSIAERKEINYASTVDRDVPIVFADAEKIRRIIENLASNAIKYTQRGGKVELHISYDKATDEVVMEMSDNGMGIKKENLPYIFDRFVQIDRSSYRRYSGSGLGLAVVKELVSAHQGTVEVESQLKVGSVFRVKIPVAMKDKEQEDETAPD
jgi:signal transduction histidine kinase